MKNFKRFLINFFKLVMFPSFISLILFGFGFYLLSSTNLISCSIGLFFVVLGSVFLIDNIFK